MTAEKNIIRFDKVRDLADPSRLEIITGPIVSINIAPLSAIGFSGSIIERLTIHLESGHTKHFVLKQTSLEADWLSQRSGDTLGREAALLGESRLLHIWNIIGCPYLAFAAEKERTGLLMHDYSNHLFPDVRKPLAATDEALVIDKLAALHASFWNAGDIANISWLMQGHQYLDVLAPYSHPSDQHAPPPDKIRDSLLTGWEIALNILPENIKSLMLQPANELFSRWRDLPKTLLHGDAKLANMAIVPPKELIIFDWPYVGTGPCGIELGWYIAVNSTRLAHSKEALITLYRSALERHLNTTLPDPLWSQMIDLALIAGARLLLWNKALAYQAGTQRGLEEWKWWVQAIASYAQ